MHIWLITIGEQLPIKQQIRKLRTAYLADELLSRGHSVRWWASAFDHFKKAWLAESDKEVVLSDQFKISLIKGCGYKRNISPMRFLDHRLLARKFRQQANAYQKPDLIIASMPAYDLAYEAIQYGKQFNIPVLVDIRDQWPDIFVDKSPLPRGFTTALLASEFRLIKSVMRDATGIISVSDNFLEWGLKYANRQAEKTDKVFYLGYRKGSNAANEPSFQETINSLKDKFVVTFIGTFEEFHDPSILLECADRMRHDSSVHFVLAGDGKFMKEIAQKALNLPNVTLTGWIEQHQIDLLLAHSNVGVCTTKQRATLFPNKAFAYFAFGLPVISAFEGDLKIMLEEQAMGFYYPPNNVKELIDHINKLKNSPEIYANFSGNVERLYKNKLDGEVVYKNYADHIEAIANVMRAQ